MDDNQPAAVTDSSFSLTRQTWEVAAGVRSCVVWFTGLPGSGKSTLADALQIALFEEGITSIILDGDVVRQTLSDDLGFSAEDRAENVRRVGRVAQILLNSGKIVLVALVSPFEKDRQVARSFFEQGDFIEVFVDTPLEVCIERDPKGLYARALHTETLELTGLQSPYERPSAPELIINDTAPLSVSVSRIRDLICSSTPQGNH